MGHMCDDCLECRLRAAVRGDAPNAGHGTFNIDTGELLNALASVAGEVLALRKPADAELFIDMIRRQRAYWSYTDHIRAQQLAAGHA
jgi:hypothetical protein